MAKTKTKKNNVVEESQAGGEVFESPEALQEQLGKTQEFIDRNKNIFTLVLTLLVLVVGGIFFYRWHLDNQNRKGQEQLFPAVFYFENDSIPQAMQGDGNFTDGFSAIANEYGSTDAGNLSSFYAGFSSLKTGNFDDAIRYLEDFKSSDYLIQARAYCLVGDAYTEKGDHNAAAKAYERAAKHYPNEQFTPAYLLKLALAYEQISDAAKAKATYQQILDTYKNTMEEGEAKKYIAMFR